MKKWKIKSVGAYYRKFWLELQAGDGTWLWAISDGRWYIFLRMLDLEEYGGSEMKGELCTEVMVVNEELTPLKHITAALQSSGMSNSDIILNDRLAVATALLEHGCYAPAYSEVVTTAKDEPFHETHVKFRTARKEAADFVKDNLLDDAKREKYLSERTVNKIGQSAAQYAEWDGYGNGMSFFDKLREIRDNPDKSEDQRLLLQMYGNADHTLGGVKIPPDLRVDSCK